jgi:hypothetical protein
MVNGVGKDRSFLGGEKNRPFSLFILMPPFVSRIRRVGCAEFLILWIVIFWRRRRMRDCTSSKGQAYPFSPPFPYPLISRCCSLLSHKYLASASIVPAARLTDGQLSLSHAPPRLALLHVSSSLKQSLCRKHCLPDADARVPAPISPYHISPPLQWPLLLARLSHTICTSLTSIPSPSNKRP